VARDDFGLYPRDFSMNEDRPAQNERSGAQHALGAVSDLSASTEQMYAAAAQHYAAREFSQAENLCRRVLALAPKHAASLNLLGLIAQTFGHGDIAVDLMRKALAEDPNNPEIHFNIGSALLSRRRLDEAAAHYRQAIALRSNYTEAHNNLGTVLKAQGNLAEARTCFERAQTLQPNSALVHFNLGNVLNALGRPTEAIASLRRAIELEPGYVGAHNNLSIVLLGQCRSDEAEVHCRRALTLDPNYAEAHINLGNVLKAVGRLDEAVSRYQRALMLRPGSAEALNNLGATLMVLGSLDAAAEHFRRAISLNPRLIDPQINLGKVLIARGDLHAAVTMARRILEMSESEEAKAFFVDCASWAGWTRQVEGLRPFILRALAEGWGHPEHLTSAAIDLVKDSAEFAAVVRPVTQRRPDQLSGRSLLEQPNWAAITQDQVLLHLLASVVIADPELEQLLAAARFALLESAAAAGPAEIVPEPLLAFYCALARQCFINEYIFDYSDREIEMAERLRDVTLAALQTGAEIPALWLVAVAAYYPLRSLAGISAVLNRPWPAVMDDLLTQQIREPAQESALRESIPRLVVSIDDQVSVAVQRQYEENPYPRWVNTTVPPESPTVPVYLRRMFPLVPLRDVGIGAGVDILVAGCGTGRHSIDTARRFHGARVLAVDLSLTSLCYAQRKTRELRITNIEYAQADILKLGSLSRSFDVIESIGVLHHLADPFAAWRILLSLLRPRGFMLVGLYSSRARREVIEAANFLTVRGYGSSAAEIRRGRRDLASFEGGRLITRIAKFIDFGSTSGCRDLLFHVQEQSLTLCQISEFLAQNNLSFIGFESLSQWTFSQYRARFPDDKAMIDLDHWNKFEEDNPDTFGSMYKFWVQKQ